MHPFLNDKISTEQVKKFLKPNPMQPKSKEAAAPRGPSGHPANRQLPIRGS